MEKTYTITFNEEQRLHLLEALEADYTNILEYTSDISRAERNKKGPLHKAVNELLKMSKDLYAMVQDAEPTIWHMTDNELPPITVDNRFSETVNAVAVDGYCGTAYMKVCSDGVIRWASTDTNLSCGQIVAWIPIPKPNDERIPELW